MPKPTGVWGIDVGQCALKAMRLELIDGQPTVTAFDYIEHSKILSQPDADPDALTREALEKFLSRNPVKSDHIAMSIAGQSGLARFVKLPPVEEKRISEIVKFEAKQQIPFPLEEVEWDYQKIAGGETIGGFAMEMEIGLFAMKRDIISKHLSHYQSVRAEVHYVQMAPLALCNYVTYEILKLGGPDAPPAEENDENTPKGKRRCAVILDIGTDSSNLIITDGGKIIWQRPVPLGGNNFTRALTKELKLTFAKAEHLKRNAAKSPDLAAILKALRPVLADFVGEVQRSLGYFTNTHRDAHVAYLIGLGSAFKLPGLQKYLSEKLALEVRKPGKFERLSGDSVLSDPVFAENLLTYPVSYGLALQGLSALSGQSMARLMTNLLPNQIRVDRIIRAKKPWAAAAAACLLMGVGTVAWGYGAQYTAIKDKAIEAEIAKGKTAVTAATAQLKEQDAKQSEVASRIKDVAAIISGNEERLNWVRLQEVIAAALPRPARVDKNGQDIPGSTNLDLPEQRFFWTLAESKRNHRAAYKMHLERLSSGVPVEKLFDEDLSEHLAMVNIESVDCRYTDNLQGFLTEAAKYAKKESGLEITDDLLPAIELNGKQIPAEKEEADKKWTPKAPSGNGWVVEIRGYTYNSDATKFLRVCFVKNLQASRLPSLRVPDPTDPNKYIPLIDNGKVTSLIPDAPNPINECISHVFLCLSDKPTEKSPNGFRFIGTSKLDQLIFGTAAPGAAIPGGEGGGTTPIGPGPMGPGSGYPTGVPATGPYKPLIRGSAGGPAEGGGRPGETGGRPGEFGGRPGDSGSGPGGPAINLGGKITTKLPHEFIIYFIWREPSKIEAPKAAGS